MVLSSTATPAFIISGFHALSDPLRLRVIELLRQREMCVCELCAEIHVTQSKLSFHLKTLKEAGLVISRHEGRWIYYNLNLEQIAVLEQYLTDYRHCTPALPARPCKDID